MKEFIVTVGVVGSGKSRYTQSLTETNDSYIEINRGNIRKSLFHVSNWSEYNNTISNEHKVTLVANDLMINAVHNGKSIIISDNNLHTAYVDKYYDFASRHDYKFIIKLMNITYQDWLFKSATWGFNKESHNIQNQFKKFSIVKGQLYKKYFKYIY